MSDPATAHQRRPAASGALVRAAAVLVSAVAAGCLVYTDPINVPPRVQVDPPERLLRGQAAEFKAIVSDDRGDISLQWTYVAGTEGVPIEESCPSSPVLSQWPGSVRSSQSTLTVAAAETRGPFCVWVLATDRDGAKALATYAAQVTTHAPEASFDLRAPGWATSYPRYHRFVLFSTATDLDEDPLTSLFEIDAAPPGWVDNSGPCTDSGGEWCFTADLEGRYVVSMRVFDGLAEATTTASFLVAPDRLPCLGLTSPSGTEAYPLAGEPLRLAVDSVDDDGDPLPGPATAQPEFRWYLGVDDAPLLFWGESNTSPSFTIPANYFAPNTLVRVRVDVYDRNPDAVRRALDNCGDADVCIANGDAACSLRHTWTVHY